MSSTRANPSSRSPRSCRFRRRALHDVSAEAPVGAQSNSRLTGEPGPQKLQRGAPERLRIACAREASSPTAVAVRHTPLTATSRPRQSQALPARRVAYLDAWRPSDQPSRTPGRRSAHAADEFGDQTGEHRRYRHAPSAAMGVTHHSRKRADISRSSPTRSQSKRERTHRLGYALDSLALQAGRARCARRAGSARETVGSRRSRPRQGTLQRDVVRPPTAPRRSRSRPSWSSAERTRAGSFSPVATST